MAKTDKGFLPTSLLLLPRHARQLPLSGCLVLLPRPTPGARPRPSPAPRGRACSLLGGDLSRRLRLLVAGDGGTSSMILQ
ncbi:hypothetical protein PAHAL_3G118400 [Panicum hallii]|uniref:Uncharacterized protein n=1 Tax=Panicum hallii TaxID=206008 RepID=A0A2T8KHV8_9POAL|nr:hypothetical protein PAHAL_3G118400 [Panicum hallii]